MSHVETVKPGKEDVAKIQLTDEVYDSEDSDQTSMGIVKKPVTKGDGYHGSGSQKKEGDVDGDDDDNNNDYDPDLKQAIEESKKSELQREEKKVRLDREDWSATILTVARFAHRRIGKALAMTTKMTKTTILGRRLSYRNKSTLWIVLKRSLRSLSATRGGVPFVFGILGRVEVRMD